MAAAKPISFAGAQGYLAKPPARRGASTAMKAVNTDMPADSNRSYARVMMERRAEGMTRIARPWTATATGTSANAYDTVSVTAGGQ